MERIDLSKEVFHKIKDLPETDSLTEYYKNISLNKGEEERTIGYTFAKNPKDKPEEIDPDEPKCYAKLYMYRGDSDEIVKKYFVKQNKYQELFNPFGMYSEGMENEKVNRVEPKWYLRQVTQDCFYAYMQFLQSKNTVSFSQAERFNNS
jgi:hypothetical protein